MSHYAKKDSSLDSLTDRFRDSLSCSNKPDLKEPDLGSPVSPLTAAAAAATATSSASTTTNTTGRISLSINNNNTNNNNNAATSSTSTSSGSGGSSGSVTSKTGNAAPTHLHKRTESTGKSHSGELSETSPLRPDPNRPTRSARPDHRRSCSAGAPLIYSGSSFGSGSGATSSVSSGSPANLLPSGNICPSGKILKTGLAGRVGSKIETLGSGTGHYGHGSIMRGGGGGGGVGSGGVGGNKLGGGDPEEVKRAGNEMYKRRNFVEALALYDKAIALSPRNAAYRSNRAAALTAIGRLSEAVGECEEAVRLDPVYARAHQRLASLYLRLGQAENARRHLCFPGQQPDPSELQKLQSLEDHLNKCAHYRKIGDWKSAIRETDAASMIGADASPQLVACKAEAYLKLHQLEDAESTITNVPKFEHYNPETKFFGMVAEAYLLYVRAQIDMALGRFENAVSEAEKAGLIDCNNVEIAMVLTNVKMVARARTHGNNLFSSGRYSEASSAYGEGLKYDPFNSILYCNRAVCWSKLGLWEKSVEDCNQALRIQPNYTKALLRRAASNGKLGRWAEAVKDYEILRKELPWDKEVMESLQQAQLALKESRGELHCNNKFGSEVEEVSSLDKFKSAISAPGVSVVHFKAASDEQHEDISPFINMLCVRYPSIHFFKVDVEESLAVAKAENIRSVPTFKIYKHGEKVKEIIRPSHQLLEDSVRSYIP